MIYAIIQGDIITYDICVCYNRYTRPISNETKTNDDGYPLYKRRALSDGGCTGYINDIIGHVDNRWVVPYNALLLHAFDAHINVEACHSMKAIKYVCKYIVKGGDMVTVTLEQRDEIELYLNGRYVSSAEAAWRIFGFLIHMHYPAVFICLYIFYI